MIATKEIDASQHFGEEFAEADIQMELTKKASGSIIKGLKYKVSFCC